MIIMVCNAGSTSLKFKIYDFPSETVLCSGGVERVGSQTDAIFKYANSAKDISLKLEGQSVPDYTTGIQRFLAMAIDEKTGALASVEQIDRVGFKTVLSRDYYGVHELTEPVLEGMRYFLSAAPAHNGPYLEAIEAMRQVLPTTKFVGAFETAFHKNIPLERRIYGVPYEWYEKYGVARMGYHGASHSYSCDCITEREGKDQKIISCHLGGSGSICAIDHGGSVDSSFGLTLQTGLIHNNRTGAVDPDLYYYLQSKGLSNEEIHNGFTKEGGLLGISGVSKDLRYVIEAAQEGNARAQLAVDVYVTGIVRYIGAFYAELGGLDCLSFTGGIGENSALIRQMVCSRVSHFGIQLDEAKNLSGAGIRTIHSEGSSVKIYVIPCDEELGVARKTYTCN